MRVTGGRLRSRHLAAPRGQGTRPTSDRVREALFSMLAAEAPLEGAIVLDLYAGTGALAIEALSRGAAQAVLIEKDRVALAAIAENVKALDLGDVATVLPVQVERATGRLGDRAFDLIFADPPYRDVPSGAFATAIAPILASPSIAADARFVLELASRDALPDLPTLELRKERIYGDTRIAIFGVRS